MDEEKKAAEGAEEAAATSAIDTSTEPVKEAAAVASYKVCLPNTAYRHRAAMFRLYFCMPQGMPPCPLFISIRQQEWGLSLMTVLLPQPASV